MSNTLKLIDFHEGQKKIVREFVLNPDIKFGCVNVGRQWGKSLLAMNIMIAWMVQNPRSRGGWITPISKQYIKALKDIKKGAHAVIQSSSESGGIIRFKNGSELQFLSTENEDGVRGFTFDFVVCDESGFIKDGAYQNLAPTWGVQGKKVLFISTPGIKNWYHKQFKRGLDPKIKNTISFTASSYDNPYYPNEELDALREVYPEQKFRQEYLAEFSESSGGVFIDYEGRCRIDDYVKESDEECFVGIDVARGGEDYTSMVFMNEKGAVINREYWREWDTKTQVETILEVCKGFKNIKRMYIETNQEVGLFQEVRRLLQGEVQVEEWYTTMKNKPTMIQNLATDIQQRNVALPTKECDPVLFEEMGDFTFEKKENGYIKYGHSPGKHDDSIISLALANEARVPIRHIAMDWHKEFDKWN